MRCTWLTVLLVLVPAAARAQEVRARVEYVAGGTLYLGVPTADRWLPGDTVRLAHLAAAEWAGRARVLGANGQRVAAEWLTGAIPFVAGDSVRLSVPALRVDTASMPPQREPVSAREAPRAAAEESTPRLTGRLALELDAARYSFEGSSAMSSVMPTARLRAIVDELPGAMRLRTNVRATYRHFDGSASLPSSAHVFANEVLLERIGERVQWRAGRFANLHEPYSGYWDGAAVRVGRAGGVGGGVAAGFEPRFGNQAPQADRARLAAFIDAHHDAHGFRYDTDLSLHRQWPRDTGAVHSVGWSQQIAVGGVRATQLLRVDAAGGVRRLGLLQLAASAPLTTTIRVRARYLDDDPQLFFALPAGSSWRSRRAGAGINWFGARANAGVDLALSWRDSREARTLSGWLDVPRLPLGIGGDANVSTWSSGDDRTLLLSAALRRIDEQGMLRLGYERYHHEWLDGADDAHALLASGSRRLGRGTFDLQLRQDWGPVRSTRLLSTYWVTL